MPRIYICHRQQDAGEYAQRLYTRLVQTFDRQRVFLAHEALALGEDYAASIEHAITGYDVVLVVIGRAWTAPFNGQQGDSEDDMVRLEVAAALRRGVPVVPVLVEDAALPDAEALPPELTGLAGQRAVSIRAEHFDQDADLAIVALARSVDETRRRATALPLWQDLALEGAAVNAGGMVLFLFFPEAALLLIGLVVVSAVLFPWLWLWRNHLPLTAREIAVALGIWLGAGVVAGVVVFAAGMVISTLGGR